MPVIFLGTKRSITVLGSSAPSVIRRDTTTTVLQLDRFKALALIAAVAQASLDDSVCTLVIEDDKGPDYPREVE